MWSLYIIIILAVIFFSVLASRERFEVPLKNVVIKYPKAYYYEFENAEYIKRLNTVLTPTHRKVDIPKRDDLPPPNVDEAFRHTVELISRVVQNSKVMQLPDGLPTRIQTVESKLLGWKLSKHGVYLQFTCTFYRESKYAGKKVEMSVYYNFQPKDVTVLHTAVIEEVSEDQIALFPVESSPQNPFMPSYEDAGPSDSRPIKAMSWLQTSYLRSSEVKNAKDPKIQEMILKHTQLFEDDINTRIAVGY